MQSKKSSEDGIFEWGKIKNKKSLKRRKAKIVTEEITHDAEKSNFEEKLFYPNTSNKNSKKESKAKDYSIKKTDLIKA